MLGLDKESQKRIVVSLNRHFVLISVVLAVALFTVQFFVLAAVGTKGAEVSQIRTQKEYYRLENERLQAEIDSVRTLSNLREDVKEEFDLRRVAVSNIESHLKDEEEKEKTASLVLN